MNRPTRPAHAVVLLLAASLLAGQTSAPATTPATGGDALVEVRVLSNRADLLSGGDALVEVVLPAGADPATVRVDVDGRDVTERFATRSGGRVLGLIDGLSLGRNVVTATLPDGRGALIPVTNHPVGGPIFAGRQVQPWLCTTEQHGLGPANDADCNTPAVHDFFYRSISANGFAPYDPASPPPSSDVAMTTTDRGHTVPYIVRRERGVIDRGIYDVAVLFDPSRPWDPFTPQEAWNRKLFWTFGGSCQPYHAQQPPDGRPDGGSVGVFDDRALSRGFMVASSGFSTLGNNCNTVVSAEALMMIKEHIVEAYGELRYTFGLGASGGSIQQVQIADAYPGLLDGIIPQSTFADLLTTANENLDCRLLVHYFRRTSPHLWTPASMQAVEGHGLFSTCEAWISVYGFPSMLADPTLGCTVPLLSYLETDLTGSLRSRGEPDWVYHPESNRGGVRCTIYDYMGAILGYRPDDGFARRPFDNVGVQYGLEALLAGAILPEQFVDLNEKVGGIDHDYRFQQQRTLADPGALAPAYRSGQVTSGRWLSQVPILDSSYAVPDGDIHTAFHAWKLRERIAAANGAAPNHVIRQQPGGRALFDLMDEWLAAMEADTETGTLEERVVRNKPADATDTGSYGGTNPRIAAGAPLRDDVLKCQVKPLDRADYAGMPVPFTDAQWARLQAAFPTGVCDWARPGVDQQHTIPWATYAGGAGPIALGDPPRSEPFAPGTVLAERYGGPTRIETAVAVSGRGVDRAETVVLARADDYPDALAGAPLAVALGAPLLLTDRRSLSAPAAAEIRRLGATSVVLLGGEAALAPQVATDVEALGARVRRIGGQNRYATASAIAAQLPHSPEVLLARGDDFPDAVAASALGATIGAPVLLLAADRVPVETAAALSPHTDALVVGGTAAVSVVVAAAVDAAAGTVTRLAGPDRYGTSAAVADAGLARGIRPTVAWLATGASFPDALVAGAAAGRDRGVLLLVDGRELGRSAASDDWLRRQAGAVERLRIAGGTAAISAGVAGEAVSALTPR